MLRDNVVGVGKWEGQPNRASPRTPLPNTRVLEPQGHRIMATIKVLDQQITVQTKGDDDYICLTDIARYKDAERTDYIILN
jgi:hypothetical protein